MEQEWVLIFFILFIAVIVQIAFWIWGIISIENAIRDDLKRYHDELTIEQIEKAISFYETIKGKKKG
jgi:hypothetical protein